MDAEREALAQRFLETEVEVRRLRNQYHSGILTRDELQDQLRDLLILDDDQNWWMMGVDSDTWYRFDPEVNNWVPAEPPRPGVAPGPRGPRTETSSIDPDSVLRGALPLLDDERTEATRYDETRFQDSDGMPLPRPVPVRDPESTMPNARAADLDDWRRSEAPTLEGTQPVSEGETATLPAQPADTIASPAQTDFGPPDYALEEDPMHYQRAVADQRQRTLRQILLIGSLVIGGAFILGAAFIILLVVIPYNNIAAEYRDAVAGLANYEPEFRTARILDADGNLLAELSSQAGGQRDTLNTLSDISPELIYTIVAMENQRFFEDPGYDPLAIARAFLQNLEAGTVISGASTITQQIASSLILRDSTPTAQNKQREIVIASEIAQRYSKNEILLLYLNEVFFGNQSYGVEAAAQFYFDKPARDIDWAEAAILASLLNAPAANDPVINREAAFAQMRNVLRRVAQVDCLGFQHAPFQGQPYCLEPNEILRANGEFSSLITLQLARVESREYLPRAAQIRYPHFVNFVLAQLERDFGTAEVFQRGFQVRTTLMPDIQDAAQEALVTRLNQLPLTGLNTGSVMVTDPRDGAIRAMVGSPDFNNPEIAGQVNGALTWQQPGSTIKPVVYTAALEGVGDRDGDGVLGYGEYLTPASILWDVPTTFQNPLYSPVNFNNVFRGPVSVRAALAQSINVAAVKAYAFIGDDKFIETARRMGLTFLTDPPNVSLQTAAGGTEVRLYDMMQAYGTLASGGRYVPLYAIVSIQDADGQPVPRAEPPAPAQRVEPEVAFLINNILSDPNARAEAFGVNTPIDIARFVNHVGVKTGTTNDNRDLWTMGYTRNWVVGVWMGRPDDAPTRGTSSLDAAGRVWNTTMTAALAKQPPVEPPFTAPPNNNITQQIVCGLVGKLDDGSCANRRPEFFIVNRPPLPADYSLVQEIPIDTWTGQRANDACPENVAIRRFAEIADAFAIQWLNTGQGQPVARQLNLPSPIEQAPSTACSINTQLPTARLINPQPNEVISGIVQFEGVISAQNFARYQFEIARAAQPDQFSQPIVGPITTQPGGQAILGEWDTRSVPNGQYILRMAVFANQQSGGGFLYRTVPILIENIQPTSTPVPLPTAAPLTNTPIPFLPPPSNTPIPFNDGAGGGGVILATPTIELGGGFPTPTATISLGG